MLQPAIMVLQTLLSCNHSLPMCWQEQIHSEDQRQRNVSEALQRQGREADAHIIALEEQIAALKHESAQIEEKIILLSRH